MSPPQLRMSRKGFSACEAHFAQARATQRWCPPGERGQLAGASICNFVLVKQEHWAPRGAADKRCQLAGAYFTCFTSTKVQILTPEALAVAWRAQQAAWADLPYGSELRSSSSDQAAEQLDHLQLKLLSGMITWSSQQLDELCWASAAEQLDRLDSIEQLSSWMNTLIWGSCGGSRSIRDRLQDRRCAHITGEWRILQWFRLTSPM